MKDKLKFQHICSTLEAANMEQECRISLPTKSKPEESENLRISGLSFRNRLTILVLVSILVPVIITGILAFSYFDQQLRIKLASQLTAEQKIFSMQLDHHRDGLVKGLERIVADNTLQVTLVLGIDAQLENYLKQQMSPLGFTALGVFDRNFQLIAHQGELSAACVASGEPLFIDHDRGELCMRAPISKDGSQLGEAIASISVASADFLKMLKNDLSSHPFLLIDGRPVLSDLKSPLPLGAIMSLRVDQPGVLSIAGEEYIVQISSRDYYGHPVVLGTMLLRDKEYLGYWNAAAKIILVLLLVALLLVIVMQKFVQDLLRPISRLTDAARQIERGDTQRLRLNCKRTDELGLLNRSFVKMATTQQRHAEQLEKMVAERTSELLQLNQTLKKDIEARELAEHTNEQLEQQLFQTQKMEAIGTMAGGIAHDMNNTLVPIFAYTEMVMRQLPEDDKNHGRLAKVRLSANRCRDLVSQILMFSRQGSAEKTAIQPHLVVMETAKLLRASIPSTVKIIDEIDENCGQILANESQIHQIILNLCTNAAQAMNQDGALLISLRRVERKYPESGLTPPFVLIEVTDTGCGMTEEVRKRIFEPFFTTKEVGKGTGMGLSVVHGIISSHGGEITCISNPGKGTCFRVFLPLLPEDQALELDAPEPLGRMDGNERILLLDDELEITSSWAEYLREYGYRITCVNNVSEARKVLNEADTPFNLLVSDQTMPQKTGLQLARELYLSYPTLPILLCTGNKSDLDEEDLHGTSIQDVLLKPLSGSELIAAIRRTFSNK